MAVTESAETDSQMREGASAVPLIKESKELSYIVAVVSNPCHPQLYTVDLSKYGSIIIILLPEMKIPNTEQAQIPTALVFYFYNLDCPPREDAVI